MRSSKSRSRSKANRPRSLGNIVNRVFDSSGPEGKVRGTPQQIIEKYSFLARDAQLSNDRVAAENFLQHAEHYTRMLAEAQREMAAEQEARRQGQDGQGGGQHGQRNDRQDRSEGDDRGEGRNEGRSDTRGDDRNENRRNDRRDGRDDRRSGNDTAGPAAVIELGGAEDEAGLVETPEARRNPPERERGRNFRRRDDGQRNAQPAEASATEHASAPETPQAAAQQGPAEGAPDTRSENPAETAAPEAKPRAPRRPRSPRKPKGESDAGGDEAGNGDPRAAAE